MHASTLSNYLADSPPTVVQLEIAPHFSALTPQQKRYAHHLSRAAFHGTRITLAQVSPESVPIYDLIIAIHKGCNGDYKKLAGETGTKDDAVRQWLEYAAQFLGNCGNYKGFGDSKFIPRVAAHELKAIARVSVDASKAFEKVQSTGGGLYETKDAGLMHLGYPDQGHMSTYYPNSEPISKDDIQIVGDVLEAKGLPIENTRLRKVKDGNFELLVASSDADPRGNERDLKDVTELDLTGSLKGKKLSFVFGDYKDQMAAIEKEIKLAEKEALNDTEAKMMAEYAKSFKTGSIEAYKESQRWWIKDKKPMVETDIGFVETYRDPHGVRGEWEGFVAMVNLERTKAFGKLVDAAGTFIPKLPWGKEFEKDKFLSPDFTSLEVLSFAGSGIPAGIVSHHPTSI
jgi:dipeptidyl-peptidase III